MKTIIEQIDRVGLLRSLAKDMTDAGASKKQPATTGKAAREAASLSNADKALVRKLMKELTR